VIKPAEQSIRLADQADGAAQHLDVEELRDRLTEAFRACGIQEAWVPDDLLDVLERRLRENGGAVASLLDCDEIYRLLAESLTATGFADVAAAFLGQNWDAAADDEPPRRREWSADDIDNLLAEKAWAPTDGATRARLAQASVEALARLAISGGTDARLVAEIARNLLAAEPPAGAPSVPSSDCLQQQEDTTDGARLLGDRAQYIAADQWALSGSQQLQELLRLRILRPCPASDILPIAVVECNLARLYDLATPPRQEDELAALLKALCTEINSLLAQMHARMAQCWPELRPAGARILFNRYGAFLKLACPGRRRKELAALKTRLAALWAAHLEAPAVALCFSP